MNKVFLKNSGERYLMFYCDKEFIGKIIQTKRKKMNIKQSELAELVGISEKHLSKIETGKNYPSLDNFLKMAKILEFNLDSLGLNVNEPKNPDKATLLKIIFSASDKEAKNYLEIINSLKKIMAQN